MLRQTPSLMKHGAVEHLVFPISELALPILQTGKAGTAGKQAQQAKEPSRHSR